MGLQDGDLQDGRLRTGLGPVRRLLALAVLAGGVGVLAGAGLSQVPQPVPPGDLQKRLELLAEAMTIIRDRHISKPEATALLDGAIRGMLEKTDPDAHYFNKEQLAHLRADRTSPLDLAGTGLTIHKDPGLRRGLPGGFRVVSAIDGSPAARAGLKAHDLVTHINGEALAGWPVGAAESKLFGPPGTTVILTVIRRGSESDFDVTLERRPLTVAPEIRDLGGGLVLVRVGTLEDKTEPAMTEALLRLKPRLTAPFAGLILDLRNSPTGTVKTAAAFADAFLDSGIIVTEKTRRNDKPTPVAVARAGDSADGRPIVVLINGGTAMAAEMVAVALRGNKRATILGTKSFGRAADRQLIELGRPAGDAGAVLLTTKRYFGPAGEAIDGQGVTPDVAVEQAALDPACREGDMRSAEGPCVLRSDATDTQLQWAMILLQGREAALATP